MSNAGTANNRLHVDERNFYRSKQVFINHHCSRVSLQRHAVHSTSYANVASFRPSKLNVTALSVI